MRRWALYCAVLLSLTCLVPSGWALSLSGSSGSLPTVSCPDTGGNHLNFSGGVWTCGTSSSGGVPGNAFADGTTKGVATFAPSQFSDNGSGLISLAPTQGGLTLSNTNTYLARDDRLTLQDDGDATKQARFQLSGITAGQTRLFTLPNFDATVATLTGTETFTGKTMSGSTNTFSNLPETALALTDVTTGNATTLAHGFLPKLPGGTTAFLRADGTYAVPPGGSGSGDITDVGTCTTGACFTDVVPGAALTYGPITAPATPGSGKATVYVDSTSKNLAIKDDAGVVNHGVQTVTQTAGQWLAAIADDGSVTKSAPTKSDVGLANVDNTSDADKNSATAPLTNKQIVPRVVLCTPSANVITPNADTMDVCYHYALTAGTTIANPTATGSNPVDQQRLELSFKSAAPQTLSWGAAFTAECGIPLPTSTTGDSGATYDHFLFRYSTTSTKWCLLASSRAPARALSTFSSTTSPVAETLTCPVASSEQCDMTVTGTTGTLTIGLPSGSPTNGQQLMLGFLCTNAQTLAWNAAFVASAGIPLPTSCPANTSQWMMVGLIYRTGLAKWQALATTQ